MNQPIAALAVSAGLLLPGALAAAPPETGETRTIRLIQDDAQEYMISKVYELKYLKANDVAPFVLGVVKRNNTQSTVNRINYRAGDEQLLTVSCPVRMMPYVDDLIAKLDRPARVAGGGEDPIRGTGITRNLYPARFRSARVMVDVMTGTGINGGADSFVGYDAETNLIYWKDDANKSNDLLKYLAWLDRPVPMVNLAFTVYEVRESTLRDLGIDYLAWRNGPGLNLLQAGFNAMSLDSAGSAALSAASGGFGAFFIAPQFDASFIRLLQQSGNAEIRNRATLTVCNNTPSAELYFNPQFQNIAKSDNDKTSVTTGLLGETTGLNQLYLKLLQPIVNLHYGVPQEGYPASEEFSINPYQPGAYTKYPGTVFFGYDIQAADIVERNNVGSELVETSQVTGNTLIELGRETILAEWNLEQEVEQTIGMPFLMEIPILKYLFSTTTTSLEKSRFYLAVTAEMLDTAKPAPADGAAGELIQLK